MTVWNTSCSKGHAYGAAASEGEIPTTWETWETFCPEEAIVKLLLLSKRYFREKQKEGWGSMLPLAGFTMVMPFLLHDKSDALQLCRSLHAYKQPNSQGSFSEDQLPPM